MEEADQDNSGGLRFGHSLFRYVPSSNSRKKHLLFYAGVTA